MSTQNKYNLNRLLTNWPDGMVYTQRYLTNLGYYHDLVRRYKKSRWIEPVGPGVYKKYGDTVDWRAGVSAIQTQLNLTIHPGGRTALEILGYAHYIRFKDRVFLFGKTGETLPKWFYDAGWQKEFEYHQTQLFSNSKIGLMTHEHHGISLTVSSPERAAMEMLYLVPKTQGFDEADKIMNGLLALRPDIVQGLLESCQSIKTKRLFLYLSERNRLTWFTDLKLNEVDLGSGKRVIVKNGKYNAKYQISIPEIKDL
jgi:hypothetical protein